LRVSLLCGAALGIATFVKMLLIDNLMLGNDAVTVNISAVVSFTLIVTIIVAKLVGCLLPLLAQRLGLDPAVMASPFITTIVDALSLLIYLGIASAIIPGLN